jgi:hypothetical protein
MRQRRFAVRGMKLVGEGKINSIMSRCSGTTDLRCISASLDRATYSASAG